MAGKTISSLSVVLSATTQKTVFDAFNVKGLMSGAIAQIGAAGEWMKTQAATWAPIIAAGFQSIYDTAAPIIGAVAAFVSDNWRTMLEKEIGYLSAGWSFVKAAFGGIWAIITSVGSAISSAWSTAMNALGV